MATGGIIKNFQKGVAAFKAFGWKGSLKQLFNYSNLRQGTLIGTDIFGNKYFEAIDKNEQLYGRDRWVEFSDGFDPTGGARVPPEWHSWLHHTTDLPANALLEKFNQKFTTKHKPNPTGTQEAYTPDNFLWNDRFGNKSKIEEWTPTGGILSSTPKDIGEAKV